MQGHIVRRIFRDGWMPQTLRGRHRGHNTLAAAAAVATVTVCAGGKGRGGGGGGGVEMIFIFANIARGESSQLRGVHEQTRLWREQHGSATAHLIVLCWNLNTLTRIDASGCQTPPPCCTLAANLPNGTANSASTISAAADVAAVAAASTASARLYPFQ